ncbi:magnesium/cobalt transporter CorA [Rubripirellula reticaptiva]|uniref:Magnesium transport protein CorA n=1 Tax=Rubripirellula reticaptiva TaxID=2528013 RepID=A0A5C6EGY8_9BACT|nr:magnesium/cobalt transporter CorA [Rubripirellula reticaptiva]TWU46981.1 Magnesium transport protein CorA [Rubripirellula reticaptiva]
MRTEKAAGQPPKRRLFKRTAKIVSAPGVLPEAMGDKAVSIRVIRYDANHHGDDTLVTSDDLARLLSRITSESTDESSKHFEGVTWINVDAAQNTSTLKIIGDVFGLHPLALEDVNNVHQRVKCEKYDDAMFFVARMPQRTRPFDSEQVSVFLLKGVVITFQEHSGDCLDTVRERIAMSTGRVRQRGADYLFYAILDRIVDEFFVTMEHYDEILGQFSSNIETTSQHDLPLKLHHIRDDLLQVRKITSQYREAFKRLAIDGSEILDADTMYFIRDCQDHISQLIEASDLGREYCGELRELHFAMLGQKSNDISKVLTLIATIFIPMSFISGVYGMNFDSQASSMNMPELHWGFGYPFALSLMAMTGGALAFFLYRRGWLS